MRCSRGKPSSNTRQRGGGDAEKDILARADRWTRSYCGLLSGPSGSKRRASDSVLNDGQFAVAGARSSAHRRTSYRLSPTDQVSSSRRIGLEAPDDTAGEPVGKFPSEGGSRLRAPCCGGPLSRVRILPVGVQPSDERIRRFFEDCSPQLHRMALQSLSALID